MHLSMKKSFKNSPGSHPSKISNVPSPHFFDHGNKASRLVEFNNVLYWSENEKENMYSLCIVNWRRSMSSQKERGEDESALHSKLQPLLFHCCWLWERLENIVLALYC